MESVASSNSQHTSFGDNRHVTSGEAAMWRAANMDDIEAMDYRSYKVRKRNERKIWQYRIFAVDKNFIYNQLPQEQTGATKRPMRRIIDVDCVVISPDDPKHCEIKYRRTSTNVQRDELEFESPQECKHFATKIGILLKSREGSQEPANGSPPKQTVGQRFLQLFR